MGSDAHDKPKKPYQHIFVAGMTAMLLFVASCSPIGTATADGRAYALHYFKWQTENKLADLDRAALTPARLIFSGALLSLAQITYFLIMTWAYKPSYLIPPTLIPHEQEHVHFKWGNAVGAILCSASSFTVFFGAYVMSQNVKNNQSASITAFQPFTPALICLGAADLFSFLSLLLACCSPVVKSTKVIGYMKTFSSRQSNLVLTAVVGQGLTAACLIACGSLPFLVWNGGALRYITIESEWPKNLSVQQGRGYMVPTAILHFFALGTSCIAIAYMISRHMGLHRQDLTSYMTVLVSTVCLAYEGKLLGLSTLTAGMLIRPAVYAIDTVKLIAKAPLQGQGRLDYGPTFWLLVTALIAEGSIFFLTIYISFQQQKGTSGSLVADFSGNYNSSSQYQQDETA